MCSGAVAPIPTHARNSEEVIPLGWPFMTKIDYFYQSSGLHGNDRYFLKKATTFLKMITFF
jgi:hypothetical protein